VELRNYLQVVRRRRWLIVYCCLLGLAAGAAAGLLREPVYQATATVLLQPNDPAERVTPDPGGYFDPDRYAATQVSLLSGREVLEQAARRLDVSARQLQRSVTVSVGSSSGVVLVAARDGRPERASQLANVLAETYIENRRRTEVEGLQRAAEQIDAQLEGLTARIATLRQDPAAPGRDAALEAANLQYTSLFVRQQDLLIDSSLKRGGADLVAPATRPSSPMGVSAVTASALGGLLGLMLGLGGAFLRDHLDDRIRSRTEVEELTGYPVLADLPVDRLSAKRPDRLAMHDEPLGLFAEATRTLRTSISFLGIEEPVRRIMVTSALPGEGKTLVAANLAVAFAQSGIRTLLVSADLRRPRLETMLGHERSVDGLSTVLGAGGGGLGRPHPSHTDTEDVRTALHHALQVTDVPNLVFLPAGLAPPNPAELLGSHRMDVVLQQCEEAFDVVVLDTTPVLPVTDAAALAGKAGSVLLATLAGTSRRRALERMVAVMRLTDAQVLGVVLNRVTTERSLAHAYYGHADSSAVGRVRPRSRSSEPDRPAEDVEGRSVRRGRRGVDVTG
jgi:Mrp family chromosome partitioning ATPase/capsular polysaccharide biosynthesis protein